MSGLRQSDDSQPVAQLTQTHRHPWHLGPVAEVTPETAGWAYCGLRILSIAPGGAYELVTGGSEMAVLPLSGGPLTVDVEGQRLELDGRATVFSAVTDWAYLPIDAEVRLSSAAGAELALPAARASRRFDAAHVAADDVAVEVRGAGPATRQVTNFMSPEAFDGADKLMCVELLTPDGNWSSYPPHRHDDSPECPVNNEEIYYFRIGTAGTTDYAPGRFRPAPDLHARGRCRRHCDRRRRGHVPRQARLPRPVRRRTWVSAVLPQRACWTRRPTIDGVLRRPGAPLDPRLVGAHGRRSARADEWSFEP